MTELESWRETFEACAAAGLKLPEPLFLSVSGLYERLEGVGCDPVNADVALALCRWTAFEWLGYAMIYPNTVTPGGQWCVVRNMLTFEANTIDAALQAACKAKAGVR